MYSLGWKVGRDPTSREASSGKPLGARFTTIRQNSLEGGIATRAPLRAAVAGTFADEPEAAVKLLEIYDRKLTEKEIAALLAAR